MAKAKKRKGEKARAQREQAEVLADAWGELYRVDGTSLCGLCGQTGLVTTAASSPAGTPCGGTFWCVCPNGQKARASYGTDRPPESLLRIVAAMPRGKTACPANGREPAGTREG